MNQQSPREVLQEMVRTTVKEELDKASSRSFSPSGHIKPSRLFVWWAALPLVMGAAFIGSWLPSTTSSIPLSATAESSNDANSHKSSLYPLERIVGVTTALMVMADLQYSEQEANTALDILSKRQAARIGAPIQFYPDNKGEWLNRHMTLNYFELAKSYLKTASVSHLKKLEDGDMISAEFLEETNHTISPVQAKTATYQLTSILQDDLDSQKDPKIYNEIKQLMQMWTETHIGTSNSDPDSGVALYKMRQDVILRNLKIDVR